MADLGRRLTFLHGSSAESDSYDDIILAANLFSQHQTGALIVIEREIGSVADETSASRETRTAAGG